MRNLLFRKLHKKLLFGVRQQMIALFLFTVFLTALTGMHLFNPFMEFIEQMGVMFADTLFLNDLSENLASVDEALREYLTTRDSDSLLAYYEHMESLKYKSSYMKESKNFTGEQSDLLYTSIALMLDTYQRYTETAVQAKRGRTAHLYIANYERADETASFIKDYISRLKEYHLNENIQWYTALSVNISRLIASNYVLIAAVILINIMIILYITYNVTSSIEKLSKVSEEIASGNFDAEDIIVSTEDEFLVMANAFNKMKKNIKEYIEQLHDKAETEARLMDQKMQNLKMQALLNDAELKALQLQINPHFLFNTLNAAMQLSIMEGSDKTSFFIDNLARLLRYNAGSMDRSVTLREEIAMIVSYKELFDVRFGNIQNVEFDIAPDVLDAIIPPMTIQPLVENAYIHGLGDASENGYIRIRAAIEAEMLVISVSDDGLGMSDEVRLQILDRNNNNGSAEQNKWRMHLTGIGMDNVINRLRMFFGITDVMQIKSSVGEGTTITLTVPFRKDKNDVLDNRFIGEGDLYV